MPDLTAYFCVAANSKAKERRRYRKLMRFPRLRSVIVERIKHGRSPEQIAGRLHLREARRGSALPIRETAGR